MHDFDASGFFWVVVVALTGFILGFIWLVMAVSK